MKSAEIMTLLKHGTSEKTVALAIMAGKMSDVLRASAKQVARARFFHDNAEWTEVLRLMEGRMGEEVDHATDELKNPRYPYPKGWERTED